MLILDFVSLGFFWLSSISGGTPLNLGWGCAAECLGTWSCSRQTRQFCYPVPDKMVKKGQNDKKYTLFQTEKLICRTCSRLREAKTIPCWAAHPCMAHISVPPPLPLGPHAECVSAQHEATTSGSYISHCTEKLCNSQFSCLTFFQETSESCGISAMPTFLLYKNGSKVLMPSAWINNIKIIGWLRGREAYLPTLLRFFKVLRIHWN